MNLTVQDYRIPLKLLLELLTGKARIRLPEAAEFGAAWVDPESETLQVRLYHDRRQTRPAMRELRRRLRAETPRSVPRRGAQAMNRTMQLYRIPQNILLELLTGKARIRLPEGAELGGVWVDPESETLQVRLHHPMFPLALQGQPLRVGELIVERWTHLP